VNVDTSKNKDEASGFPDDGITGFVTEKRKEK